MTFYHVLSTYCIHLSFLISFIIQLMCVHLIIVFPVVHKKGRSEGSGKLLLYVVSYKKTRHKGGGESNVSMNPGVPCLGYLPLGG